MKAPDKSVRDAVYTIKSELKRGKGVKPVPAVARTTAPASAPEVVVVAEVVPAVAIVPAASIPAPSVAGIDLTGVLANVSLVNAVVGACGGAEPARKVAEAVRACGGGDAFLQHLELVAGIRGGA